MNEELRRYAGPFDWIYSSAEMVRHCLEDNFVTLLDPFQVVKAGASWGHRMYAKMLGRCVVWPHHDPKSKDRCHFTRSCERFRRVLLCPERKLFVFASLVKSQKELEIVRSADSAGNSNAEVLRLFEHMRRHGVQNFEIVAVQVVESNVGESRHHIPQVRPVRDTGPGSERLIVYELHCKGKCTGIYFKEKADEEALRRLLRGGTDGLPVRHFNLLPDPLPPSIGERRRGRMGDPAPEAEVPGSLLKKRLREDAQQRPRGKVRKKRIWTKRPEKLLTAVALATQQQAQAIGERGSDKGPCKLDNDSKQVVVEPTAEKVPSLGSFLHPWPRHLRRWRKGSLFEYDLPRFAAWGSDPKALACSPERISMRIPPNLAASANRLSPDPRATEVMRRCLVQAVVELGFSHIQAKEAVRRCSTVSACVTWILEQSWG